MPCLHFKIRNVPKYNGQRADAPSYNHSPSPKTLHPVCVCVSVHLAGKKCQFGQVLIIAGPLVAISVRECVCVATVRHVARCWLDVACGHVACSMLQLIIIEMCGLPGAGLCSLRFLRDVRPFVRSSVRQSTSPPVRLSAFPSVSGCMLRYLLAWPKG